MLYLCPHLAAVVQKVGVMEVWILFAGLICVWFILPAFLVIAACVHSSRLSRAEDNAYLRKLHGLEEQE
jgi:hypothetical protein